MPINLPVEVIKRQEWLEPIAERLQTTVATVLGPDGPVGSRIADILHGTWSEPPVPCGADGCADWLLDRGRRSGSFRGEDREQSHRSGCGRNDQVGLVGAAGAAMTGLADWSKIGGGEPRRIGLAHGLLNATATACYVTSMGLGAVTPDEPGGNLLFLA